MTAEDLQTQSMTNVLSSACVHCGLTSDIPKCGIKCARAEREIALLREQRDTNLAKEVETVEQLHAAVKTAQELAATRLQEVERLKRDVRQFKEAIYWALGERGDFPDKLPGCGPWYWRTELRKRSGLPVNGRPDNEPGVSPAPVDLYSRCTGEPHDCPYIFCHSQLKCAKEPTTSDCTCKFQRTPTTLFVTVDPACPLHGGKRVNLYGEKSLPTKEG